MLDWARLAAEAQDVVYLRRLAWLALTALSRRTAAALVGEVPLTFLILYPADVFLIGIVVSPYNPLPYSKRALKALS